MRFDIPRPDESSGCRTRIVRRKTGYSKIIPNYTGYKNNIITLTVHLCPITLVGPATYERKGSKTV